METFEFLPRTEPDAMRIALGMNAIFFLSQLSKSEAALVSESIQRLATRYDDLRASHVERPKRLHGAGSPNLRTYRAGHDVRVFFYVENQTIYVVDIVRSRQLDRIDSLRESAA